MVGQNLYEKLMPKRGRKFGLTLELRVRMEAGSNAATEIRSGPKACGRYGIQKTERKRSLSDSHGSRSLCRRRLKTVIWAGSRGNQCRHT